VNHAAATFVVALTGGIGAGKSTVAAMLAARGAAVVDVDAVGREVAEVGGRAHGAIVARFGAGIVRDGRLDRGALAAIVFADPAELQALESISHPAINDTLAEVAASSAAEVVVLDMAILVESVLGRWGPNPSDGYQFVVVIEAPVDVRIARAVGRGMDPSDAERRVRAQAGDEARRAVADVVIVNDGDLATLERRVAALWDELLRRAG
jgi:dephospho-CoA kinase